MRWRTRRLSRLPSGVLYLRLRAGLRFKPLQELAKAFLPIGLRFDQDRQQSVLFRRIDPHAVQSPNQVPLPVDRSAAFDQEPVGLGNAPQSLLFVHLHNVRENWRLRCSARAIVTQKRTEGPW